MIQSNIKLKGEPSAQALASGLATLGRYGDNYMVHAAEGETFVPKEILDANPDLKNQLFNQMKSMGIEEPNRYVVGDALNSINPVTGQPEFFFKKIFKAVKKIFKKVLPVAAPLLGNLIAPGIGGIIASGLVTKMQGGSWGDALKSAGLSYVGGAAMRGLQGGIGTLGDPNASFFGSFGEGFKGGLTDPFKAAGNLFSTSGGVNPLSQGIFGGLGSESGNIMSGSFFNPNLASGAAKGVMDYVAPKYDPTGGVQNVTQDLVTTSANKSAALLSPREEVTKAINIDAPVNSEAPAINLNTSASNIAGTRIPTQELKNLELGFSTPEPYLSPAQELAKVQGFSPEIGNSAQQLVNQESSLYPGDTMRPEDALQATLVNNNQSVIPAKPELTLLDKAKKALMSKEFLGPALSAGVPAALTYFTADEPTEDQEEGFTDPQKTAYSQYLSGKSSDPNFPQTPEGQRLRSIFMGPAPRTAEQLSRSTGVSLADAQSFVRNRYGIPATAAAGGEITGPGTGTSDSIPAMLSDGEFVMTAQAVRNAGNGNRDLGAARMYDMMSKFERAV